ncbi:MAG: acetyl-CoA acetyltransferase [Deltaproteobacteria bacterium]|nr:acetyl-CoA acetyltransferase [Deltaproteobacteria bacterium]MBW1924158.1 acetyl-CoA acetyltransferase [Deltaproteobacteria bacterium]MBW1949927.1 acetyl-CoA acetyltransferase [Deltaproteobacteria bacterium]MBW2008458.1 acetyl-CoA acetyltransferase [Deltaproteobacteria bacterium]MBW2102221.1 acetyl-CoA acetyltransferase [Deltaproteobacteria bacterium]
MATGIRDKVAIIGMGCTRFGERWEDGAEELMVEAFTECIDDAGIDPKEIEAAWLGTCIDEINVGKAAVPLSTTLRLPFIPVTRVENYCASGTESFRGAVYAVASGAYDIALAMGVEKLKDTGYGGLPSGGSSSGSFIWLWWPNLTAPGSFAQLASAYAAKYGVPMEDLKRAMAQVSVKSHENGAVNPKAHLRKRVSIEQVMAAPIIAYPLGLFDCCGVSDGAACAIVTTVERAKDMGIKNPVTVKALQLALSSGEEMAFNEWDGDHFITTDKCSAKAYEEAGIKNPREEISMMEVHDCFSITELVTCEDLHISERGQAWKDILDGFYNSDGKVPCQIDGGLKCFGHPIGASGLRMLYEMYLQLLGRAGERQLENPRYGLTHNLGGFPAQNVCAISIIGLLD